MKEYIERADIIPALNDYYEPIEPDQPMTLTLAQIAEVIENIPAADVAEVTFCKDCRYYQDAKVNEKGFLICPASGMEITETDYCSYGERMDKEDET